jgi:clan AA aspartic protease (TIGR02281 family)
VRGCEQRRRRVTTASTNILPLCQSPRQFLLLYQSPRQLLVLYQSARQFLLAQTGIFIRRLPFNGTPVRLMADTGATVVSLSAEDARKVGIDPQSLPFTHEAHTANGTVPSAGITLPEITIEGILLRDIGASCCITGTSLLGMSALGRLSVEMQNGSMFLSPRN